MTTAAVIGSGFGGLALAVRLQAAGIRTTVFEQRDKPGGRAYVYEDEGFTFDAGPTVITNPNCLFELFELGGKRPEDYVSMLPVSPFYRLLWEDGYRFDYGNEPGLVDRQIAARNPEDVAGYQKFLRFSEEVLEEGYLKLAAEPFLDFASMIRVAPQLIRLQSYRSVYSKVARYIKDPRLRQAFSFHSLLLGGHPFRASSIYSLIHALERRWGVFFPRGGTGALVQALARLFQDLGGDLRLKTPVREICVHGSRVTGIRLEDGTLESLDMVASNADVVYTYGQLMSGHPRGGTMAARLRRKKFSPSLFVVYFGVRKQYPGLAHHTILFGPRYKELLDDIRAGKRLSDDFSLYLHAPSVSDPQLAPPGCSCFYALAPVPHLGTVDVDWAVAGADYRDRILEYLESRCLPDLRSNLVTTRIFTPHDFRDRLNAHLGSAFSLEPTLMQSAYFRVHNRDDRIRGLYFAGAGTHPGAGIPGVVASAEATGKLMIEDSCHAGKPAT